MTAEHTPGPWTVRNEGYAGFYVGPADDGGAPSVGFALSRTNSTEEQIVANARLMAAAPDLLAAARMAVCALAASGGRQYEALDAAIRKAVRGA